MVVFLDTNVILDAYFERPAHGEAAGKVMNLCATKRITGCVSTGVLASGESHYSGRFSREG